MANKAKPEGRIGLPGGITALRLHYVYILHELSIKGSRIMLNRFHNLRTISSILPRPINESLNSCAFGSGNGRVTHSI